MFTKAQLTAATRLRQDIHQHPEVQFTETRTAKIVAEHLRYLGYQVTEGVAQTGVIGLLETGREGPVIALRADMDALPIVEKNTFAYASQHAGVMHACGHDGHTATLLLAAEAIMAMRETLCGTVKLLFQPAEELGGGAEAMIAAGVLENPHVEKIFGYHNRPNFPLGQVFLKAGSAMGGIETFYLTIHGKSGHSSRPDLAVDALYVGAVIVQQLQGLSGRLKSPLAAGVISVTTFHAGNADNIVPPEAHLTINIRSDSAATYAALFRHFEDLIQGICSTYGATYDLVASDKRMPPLVNPEREAQVVYEVAKQYFPAPDAVVAIDYMPTMGAEDFAYYLEQRAGCFFFVGNGEDSAYLHADDYNFNDAILPTAATVFVGIVKHYCTRNQKTAALANEATVASKE